MTNKQGFTLAEVLITLGIIGVVAAMTIPTLMNQTNQAEFRTGFKKIVSTLSQAITMNVALDSTDFSALTGGATTDGTVYDMFVTRMNVLKTATTEADAALGGTPAIGDGNYTLFFNDGMVVSFPQACASANSYDNACLAIVDVNGPKRPNRLTNCATPANAAATTDNAGATACDADTLMVGDRFSLRFFNQQVAPNGDGARFVLFQ